jgi:hypothetical protein
VLGVGAGDGVISRVEQGLNEELAVVQEGEGGLFEEIDLMSAGMNEGKGALAMRDGEEEGAVEAKPEGAHLAVAITEVIAGIVEDVEETVDAEVLVGGEIEEELAAPAEADAGKGTGVLEALNSGAKGGRDAGGHGRKEEERRGSGFGVGDVGEEFEQEGLLADAGAFTEREGVEGLFGGGKGEAIGGFLKGAHPRVAQVEGIAEFFAEVAEGLEVGGEGVHAFLAELAGDEAVFEVKRLEGDGLRGLGGVGHEVEEGLQDG